MVSIPSFFASPQIVSTGLSSPGGVSQWTSVMATAVRVALEECPGGVVVEAPVRLLVEVDGNASCVGNEIPEAPAERSVLEDEDLVARVDGADDRRLQTEHAFSLENQDVLGPGPERPSRSSPRSHRRTLRTLDNSDRRWVVPALTARAARPRRAPRSSGDLCPPAPDSTYRPGALRSHHLCVEAPVERRPSGPRTTK